MEQNKVPWKKGENLFNYKVSLIDFLQMQRKSWTVGVEWKNAQTAYLTHIRILKLRMPSLLVDVLEVV